MSTYTSKFRGLVVKFSNREKVKFNDGKAEASGDTAKRLDDFAERHPEYGIEQVAGTEDKPETEKQRLQREARERNLSDAGKVADLKARIATHDAAQQDEGDDEDADDQNDDGDADDAGDGDSSEDDENSDDDTDE